MKNVLVITTCRDNLGVSISFIGDTSEVEDENLRNALEAAASKSSFKFLDEENSKSLVVYNDGVRIYTNGYGYIFDDKYSKYSTPLNVEHIVEFIIE